MCQPQSRDLHRYSSKNVACLRVSCQYNCLFAPHSFHVDSRIPEIRNGTAHEDALRRYHHSVFPTNLLQCLIAWTILQRLHDQRAVLQFEHGASGRLHRTRHPRPTKRLADTGSLILFSTIFAYRTWSLFSRSYPDSDFAPHYLSRRSPPGKKKVYI